jgi:hypothetical protein
MLKDKSTPFKRHDLKVLPEYYVRLIHGLKSFEFRKNDRDFRSLDTLLLQEFDPKLQEYTGRTAVYLIMDVFDPAELNSITAGEPFPEGFVIMSIQLINRYID